MNKNNKNLRPIKLERLEAGSTCMIFAEPSRGIRRVKDTTVWRKDAENTILIDSTNEERCAILYPEDLVIPMSRPRRQQQRA